MFHCLTPCYCHPIWASGEIGNVTNYLKMIFIGNGDAQKDLEAGFCLTSKGKLMLVLAGFSGVKSLPVRVWEGSSLFLHTWLSWMNIASPVCLVGERGHVARSRVSLTPCIGPETAWQHWKVSSHIWLLTSAKLKRKKQCSVICVYFSSSISRSFRKSKSVIFHEFEYKFFSFLELILFHLQYLFWP